MINLLDATTYGVHFSVKPELSNLVPRDDW